MPDKQQQVLKLKNEQCESSNDQSSAFAVLQEFQINGV